MKQHYTAFACAALLSFTPITRADEKPGAEVKGTLVMGEHTYKLAHALAYQTKIGSHQRTVVYLSEKPLDTAKLKQSFKKNGTDEGFFASGPHVHLILDDKGGLAQIALYAEGDNVILSGDNNISCSATLKDGSAKGTAGTNKPGKSFSGAYTFEVTFDVKLIKP
jgi:hypothetical protein